MNIGSMVRLLEDDRNWTVESTSGDTLIIVRDGIRKTVRQERLQPLYILFWENDNTIYGYRKEIMWLARMLSDKNVLIKNMSDGTAVEEKGGFLVEID